MSAFLFVGISQFFAAKIDCCCELNVRFLLELIIIGAAKVRKKSEICKFLKKKLRKRDFTRLVEGVMVSSLLLSLPLPWWPFCRGQE